MIEATFTSLLKNTSAVAALVGTRVRPFSDTNVTDKPCLTYWRITTERDRSNDGPTGQAVAHFQLDAWATDATTCWQILDAARQGLDGLQGTYLGTFIDYIKFEDQFDSVKQPERQGQQKPIQRATCNVWISYNEATMSAKPSSGFDSAFS